MNNLKPHRPCPEVTDVEKGISPHESYIFDNKNGLNLRTHLSKEYSTYDWERAKNYINKLHLYNKNKTELENNAKLDDFNN